MDFKKYITTSNSFENGKIKEYLGPVAVNYAPEQSISSIVANSIGSSVDLGFFSSSHQNDLNNMYEVALSQLYDYAINIGGNGVIGLHINYETVTNGTSTSFILNLTGTAVKVDFDMGNYNTNDFISNKKLQKIIRKEKLMDMIKSDCILSREDLIVLLSFYETDDIKHIFDYIINSYSTYEKNDYKYFDYFILVNYDYLENDLYEILQEEGTRSEICLSFIKNTNSFSPDHTLSLLENNKLDLVFKLLETFKSYYSLDDLEKMKFIKRKIDDIPKIPLYKETSILHKNGIFLWKCTCNATNSESKEFCSECSHNRKGFTAKQDEQFKLFSLSIKILEKNFSNQYFS